MSSARRRASAPAVPAGMLVPRKLTARLEWVSRVQAHGVDRELRARDLVAHPGHIGLGHAPVVIVVTGEDPRQVRDIVLSIGFDRLALCISLHRSVGIELVESDREQLHDLARVVLVRLAPGGGVFLEVAARVQIEAHRRVQRYLLEQRPEIAEGVCCKKVPVGRDHVGRIETVDGRQRHDEELRQGQRQAFAHRVRARQQLVPDHEIAELRPEVALLRSDRVVAARVEPVDPGLARRGRELCIQPSGVTLGFDGRKVAVAGRELGLQQKSGSLRIRGRHGCRRWRWRRRRRGRGRGRRIATGGRRIDRSTCIVP